MRSSDRSWAWTNSQTLACPRPLQSAKTIERQKEAWPEERRGKRRRRKSTAAVLRTGQAAFLRALDRPAFALRRPRPEENEEPAGAIQWRPLRATDASP